MDLRELKALELAARAKIVPNDDGTWTVPGSSAGTYKVTTWPGAESCECEDWQLRQQAPFCKHLLAAKLVEEREGKRSAPPIVTDAVPKRPTYKQNWPAYNQAQIQEKHRLQVLLADLCRCIEEPPQTGRGRRRVAVADRLFASAFKVYGTVSSRRFGCDLADAADAGHLSRRLHPNKVNCFLEDADLTEPLRQLIAISALPLRAVETIFAVDSSGFTTSNFVPWFDHKYGVTRRDHDWVKAHICTGVKTGIVTAVEIRERDANDSPLLPPLVRETARTFTVKEVSADKGYLGTENVECIHEVGGTPFIAPKSSTTGAAGGLFASMYFYYQFKREEFLAHYHKRSNVESTFSAVKRKFGDAVRSKTQTAMVNECLCKFLCNNLCCVILSQIELGIDATFWKDEPQADVLPLARSR
jgi:hypothetical protein